jgi:hypothetical protein
MPVALTARRRLKREPSNVGFGFGSNSEETLVSRARLLDPNKQTSGDCILWVRDVPNPDSCTAANPARRYAVQDRPSARSPLMRRGAPVLPVGRSFTPRHGVRPLSGQQLTSVIMFAKTVPVAPAPYRMPATSAATRFASYRLASDRTSAQAANCTVPCGMASFEHSARFS